MLSFEYFETWKSMLDVDILQLFSAIEQSQLEARSFTFYTSVSVMSSSKIEGERLEVDSYVKHKLLNVEYQPDLTEKPNDLYNAYIFAKENKLGRTAFLQAHVLTTAHLLSEKQQGTLRNTEMLVLEHNTNRIQYEACLLSNVSKEYNLLWNEIEDLLIRVLDIEEIFYYASMLHLVFVNIHPFEDANGRMARLLEKWFLSEKLGERAWYIQSEKFYYNNVNDYYRNLGRLGMFYDELNYNKSIPFLLMLPNSMK